MLDMLVNEPRFNRAVKTEYQAIFSICFVTTILLCLGHGCGHSKCR